jgi:hypothetical protein
VLQQSRLERSTNFVLKKSEDHLVDAVKVLECNSRNARDVLQHTRHVFTRLSFDIFPKKKGKPLVKNLKKLVDAFDTVKYPTRQLKRLSVKRGVRGTLALSLSHGAQVDWAQVSSVESCNPSEMRGFFAEAKKYSQRFVDFILPASMSSSTAPVADAPPAPSTTPSEVA